MDVATLGAIISGGTVLGAWDIAQAWREGGEDRVQVLDGLGVAANHHAVATLQAPDATGRPDVHVVQAFFRQGLAATHVVFIEGVAAVDDHIAGFHQFAEVVDRGFGRLARRQHDPDRPRFLQAGNQGSEVGNAGRTLFAQAFDECFIAVVDHGGMPIEHQAARNIPAHAA